MHVAYQIYQQLSLCFCKKDISVFFMGSKNGNKKQTWCGEDKQSDIIISVLYYLMSNTVLDTKCMTGVWSENRRCALYSTVHECVSDVTVCAFDCISNVSVCIVHACI